MQGLALALKTVTIYARHWGWADKAFGRKWAAPDRDPAKDWANRFLIEDAIDKIAVARARVSDPNSFLYLAKANQLFVTGHRGAMEDGFKDIKAKILMIPAESDLLLFPAWSKEAIAALVTQGKRVEYFELAGDGGHLDGVLAIANAGEAIRKFLNE